MGHKVETDKGTFFIYMGAEAEVPEHYHSLRWYYAPEGWTGEPYSKGYYSPEAAEEACWEKSGRKEDPD